MKALVLVLPIILITSDLCFSQMDCNTPPTDVSAIDGIHCDKIWITWDPVFGADGSYIDKYYKGNIVGYALTPHIYFMDDNATPGLIYTHL